MKSSKHEQSLGKPWGVCPQKKQLLFCVIGEPGSSVLFALRTKTKGQIVFANAKTKKGDKWLTTPMMRRLPTQVELVFFVFNSKKHGTWCYFYPQRNKQVFFEQAQNHRKTKRQKNTKAQKKPTTMKILLCIHEQIEPKHNQCAR